MQDGNTMKRTNWKQEALDYRRKYQEQIDDKHRILREYKALVDGLLRKYSSCRKPQTI